MATLKHRRIRAEHLSHNDSISRSRKIETSEIRLHGLDNLRALAALWVVVLHAAVPYTLHPMPGLLWPTTNSAPSRFVDAVFWGIEGFIMPLFFLMAGFFAFRLLRSRGPVPFVKHRARRLLLPLLFGCVVILPIDLYIWIWGWIVEGTYPLKKLRSLKFEAEIQQDLWGLGHLWFLQYLFLYCTILAALWWCVSRLLSRNDVLSGNDHSGQKASGFGDWIRSRWIRWGLPFVRAGQHPWSFLLILAALGAALLFRFPEVVIGFQHSPLPVLKKFAYCGLYFAAGVLLSANRSWLNGVMHHARWYLAASAVLFASTVWPMTHEHLTQQTAGVDRLLLAVALSTFAALTTLGLFGLFLGRWQLSSPILRYISEASFWIYLIHHPVVALAQVHVNSADWRAEWKFLTVAALAVAFSLLTYQAWVRQTWLGVLLNGARRGESDPVTVAIPFGRLAGSDSGSAENDDAATSTDEEADRRRRAA